MKNRIDEVEPQFAQKLNQGIPLKEALKQLHYSVPEENYNIRVSLRDRKRRKKPSHAAADNWSPEASDRIEIWFEPAAKGAGPPGPSETKTFAAMVSEQPTYPKNN